MFTKEVRASIEESVLCWLATCDESGIPNCSPKEVFVSHGDSELLIANIASPKSVNNIKKTPNVCVSFIHVFKQKGYKLKGTVKYITPESENYSELFCYIKRVVGDVFPVKGII